MTKFAKLFTTGLLAVSALAATPAGAAVILFSNFDSVVQPAPTGAGFTTVPAADGWTAGSALGIEIQYNNVAGQAFSGSSLVELDTTANSSMFVNLGAGTYEVTYWYSPRPNVAATSNGVSLSIGNVTLDSVTGTGIGQTVWQQRSVRFGTQGGALTFAAIGTSDRLGGYLDDITISAVPEPASWAMLIAGFGLVGATMRRRRTMGSVTA